MYSGSGGRLERFSFSCRLGVLRAAPVWGAAFAFGGEKPPIPAVIRVALAALSDPDSAADSRPGSVGGWPTQARFWLEWGSSPS